MLNRTVTHRVQLEFNPSTVRKTQTHSAGLPSLPTQYLKQQIPQFTQIRQGWAVASIKYFPLTHSFIITNQDEGVVFRSPDMENGWCRENIYPLPTVWKTVSLLAPRYLQMIKDKTSPFTRRPDVFARASWSKIFMLMPGAVDILSGAFVICSTLRHQVDLMWSSWYTCIQQHSHAWILPQTK